MFLIGKTINDGINILFYYCNCNVKKRMLNHDQEYIIKREESIEPLKCVRKVT